MTQFSLEDLDNPDSPFRKAIEADVAEKRAARVAALIASRPAYTPVPERPRRTHRSTYAVLREDHPEVCARFDSGEIATLTEAAVIAGMRPENKEARQVEKAFAMWSALSPQDLEAFAGYWRPYEDIRKSPTKTPAEELILFRARMLVSAQRAFDRKVIALQEMLS